VSAPLPADLSLFLSSVLVHCLGIRMVWWVHDAGGDAGLPARLRRLVIFADSPTLRILRRSDHLHRADVQALVVFDGDQFENAWGPERVSGSLARWAWRQDAAEVAYYSESNWAQGGRESGIVVRTRKKAVLVWRSQARQS
jgi:hypothetical protein